MEALKRAAVSPPSGLISLLLFFLKKSMCKAINHRQESYAFYLLYHTNNFFLIVHKITLPVCKLLPTLKYMLDQQIEYHELMFALYPIICLIKRNKWDEMIFPRGNCQWYTGIFTIA